MRINRDPNPKNYPLTKVEITTSSDKQKFLVLFFHKHTAGMALYWLTAKQARNLQKRLLELNANITAEYAHDPDSNENLLWIVYTII